VRLCIPGICESLHINAVPEGLRFFYPPYGAPEHRKPLGERPERGKDRMSLPDPRGRDAASGQRRDPKLRSAGSVRHQGALLFGDFFFGQARKSHLPPVSHRQIIVPVSSAQKSN
jgi:hypothetical protein